MTTFARLAKIVSGEIEPKNWIERAFKALATAAGGKELPDVGTNDKDKYLHTNESTGALEWHEVEHEVPAFTREDEGKFLGVVEGLSGPEKAWGNVPGTLPAYTNADKGKSLQLDDGTTTHTETVTVIQQQTVTITESQGELAENSFNFDGITVNMTVSAIINGSPVTMTVIDGGSGALVLVNDSSITGYGVLIHITDNPGSVITNYETLSISATRTVTVYDVVPQWKAAGGGDAKYINLSISGTAQEPTIIADKTFNEIAAIYATGTIMAIRITGLMPNAIINLPFSGYSSTDDIYYFSGVTYKTSGHLMIIQANISSTGWELGPAEID